MKLKEIFDVERVNDLESDRDDSEGVSGAGQFAKVFPSKEDPHMVNKYSIKPADRNERFQDHDDNYWLYANAVLDSKINQDNITFPRIYKKSDDQLQMEKLYSYKQLDHEELANYFVNNFKSLWDDNSYDLDVVMKKFELSDIAGKMETSLELCIREKDCGGITNDAIKDACAWLRNLITKINSHSDRVHLDIHSGNFMFRRTSNGLQLVITDPLY